MTDFETDLARRMERATNDPPSSAGWASTARAASARTRRRTRGLIAAATTAAAVAVLGGVLSAVLGAGPQTVAPLTPPSRTAHRVSHASDHGRSDGPNAVSFISADQGWAVDPGDCGHCAVVRETVDAGEHWTIVDPQLRLPGAAMDLTAGRFTLYFADRQHGYLYEGDEQECATCLLTTTDGGRSWRRVPLAPVAQLVSSDDSTDGGGSATIYALSLHGSTSRPTLDRSTVGSSGWTRVALPTRAPDTYLAAQGDTVALLAVDYYSDYPTHGRLWVSPDRGETWERRPVPCRSSGSEAMVVSVALGHPSAMLLDCYDGEESSQEQATQHHLFGSADAGRTWVRLSDPSETGAPDLLVDNGAGHAFLATEGGDEGLLHGSVDRGVTWRTDLMDDFGGWAGLRFVSPDVGFVLGPTHYVTEELYRTLDGGASWHTIPLPRP